MADHFVVYLQQPNISEAVHRVSSWYIVLQLLIPLNCSYSRINLIQSICRQILVWGGDWYVSNVSTFSHAFPLVLDSNLHDLNENNHGLTPFLAELPWCYFCAEIKVLGMERNFARIFYINNKNFWSPDLQERGTWVGTTHQGAPPSPGMPRWVVPT